MVNNDSSVRFTKLVKIWTCAQTFQHLCYPHLFFRSLNPWFNFMSQSTCYKCEIIPSFIPRSVFCLNHLWLPKVSLNFCPFKHLSHKPHLIEKIIRVWPIPYIPTCNGFLILNSFGLNGLSWWFNGFLVVRWVHGGKSGNSGFLNSESDIN